MKAQAIPKAHPAPDRRRAPRSTRAWDPFVESAAIALLALLAFFLLLA